MRSATVSIYIPRRRGLLVRSSKSPRRCCPRLKVERACVALNDPPLKVEHLTGRSASYRHRPCLPGSLPTPSPEWPAERSLERGPADDQLRLDIEALNQLDDDEKATVINLIESVLLRHQARRLARIRPVLRPVGASARTPPCRSRGSGAEQPRRRRRWACPGPRQCRRSGLTLVPR